MQEVVCWTWLSIRVHELDFTFCRRDMWLDRGIRFLCSYVVLLHPLDFLSRYTFCDFDNWTVVFVCYVVWRWIFARLRGLWGKVWRFIFYLHFYFLVEITSRTSVPLFRLWWIHCCSASWDNCRRVLFFFTSWFKQVLFIWHRSSFKTEYNKLQNKPSFYFDLFFLLGELCVDFCQLVGVLSHVGY